MGKLVRNDLKQDVSVKQVCNFKTIAKKICLTL